MDWSAQGWAAWLTRPACYREARGTGAREESTTAHRGHAYEHGPVLDRWRMGLGLAGPAIPVAPLACWSRLGTNRAT